MSDEYNQVLDKMKLERSWTDLCSFALYWEKEADRKAAWKIQPASPDEIYMAYYKAAVFWELADNFKDREKCLRKGAEAAEGEGAAVLRKLFETAIEQKERSATKSILAAFPEEKQRELAAPDFAAEQHVTRRRWRRRHG